MGVSKVGDAGMSGVVYGVLGSDVVLNAGIKNFGRRRLKLPSEEAEDIRRVFASTSYQYKHENWEHLGIAGPVDILLEWLAALV